MKKVLAKILVVATALAVTVIAGCAGNPTGQLALETSVRIAVRHSLADSSRAIEKARNIRSIAERIQSAVSEDWTVGTLTEQVREEVDKLDLDPISQADAYDLLDLLTVLLEQRIGGGELKPDGVIKVNEFVGFVLGALPIV